VIGRVLRILPSHRDKLRMMRILRARGC
jgi:hypothetical protein